MPLWGAYHDTIPETSSLSAWLKAMNVQAAWELGYTGDGVTLAVVDNAVSTYHNSYKDNVVYSHDYSSQQRPTSTATNPSTGGMYHGTFVASCAAGYDTSAKVFGTAYNASVMGFKTATANGSFGVSVITQALNDCLTNQTYQPNVINNSYGSTKGFSSAGLITSFKNLQDSNRIMLYSSGNNRCFNVSRFDDNVWNSKDSGKMEFQASPYTISVAALNDNYSTYSSADSYASFSCYGANTFIATPGTNIKGATPTTETDATSYNSGSGTSFSSPLAAGLVALAVEAAQDSHGVTLDTRMVKHLLASTSKVIGDPNATGSLVSWQTNAAGYTFSHSYGFGLPDAEALVKAAEQVTGITEQSILTCKIASDGTYTPRSGMDLKYTANLSAKKTSTSTPSPSATAQLIVTTGTPTPTCDPVYSKAFTIDEATFDTTGVTMQSLEEVVLTIGITSLVSSDLRIEVYHTTDANNNGLYDDDEDIKTTSVLCFEDTDMEGGETVVSSGGYKSVVESGSLTWSFSSNAFWGEIPTGKWEVLVYDAYPKTQQGSDTPVYNVTVNQNLVELSFLMGELQTAPPTPPAEVPEPSTVVMLLFGCLGLVYTQRKKAKTLGNH